MCCRVGSIVITSVGGHKSEELFETLIEVSLGRKEVELKVLLTSATTCIWIYSVIVGKIHEIPKVFCTATLLPYLACYWRVST
jgi:hypothetical protein